MSSPQSYIHSLSPATIRRGVVTHPFLHVRDAHDAHVLLEAVRQNMLPIIKRRLLSSEREELRSGHVYVWEEAQDEGGLLRWTDGRRWSQSRMRGDYLFYEERVETTQEEREAKAARRARRASDPNAILPPPTRRKDRPSKPDGLTKQTYSVVVYLPGSSDCRKWHVVAYFSENDYDRLPVIESYDYLRSIRVPNDVFFNSKVISARLDRFSQFSDDNESYGPSDHMQTNRNPLYDYRGPPSGPMPSTPPFMPSPMVPSSPRHHERLPPSFSREGNQPIMLPPITSLAPAGRHHPSLSHTSRGQGSGPTSYTPLSTEDRRVLDSFRVVL